MAKATESDGNRALAVASHDFGQEVAAVSGAKPAPMVAAGCDFALSLIKMVVGVMNMVPATFDRFRMVRWALALYLLVWFGSLQGLLLVSLVPDGSHRAIMSATSNQLRLVLHHHGHQDEHEANDHAYHRASAEMPEDVPPDHELSLAHHGQHPTATSTSGAVPIAKVVAVFSWVTNDEATVAQLRADQVDPYQFAISPALRSHRTTVLLI